MSDIVSDEQSRLGDELPVDGDATKRSVTEWSLTFKSMTTTAVVAGAMLLLFATVQPNLIFRNNTPTGGDMGAHVWGPAYLRDVLLPHFKLTGWSMDWYAGFPAYRFYMVVPALFILLFDLVLPYGIAFKIVAVIGLVAFPLCAWAMGKFARLPYPFPELLVVGAVLFLYDESFTIYGGNIASTMAGEFSFSIALAFAVLAFGLFARGLDDGKHRGWAALAIALSALCHGIVLIFVFVGVSLMLLLRLDKQRLRYGISTIGTAILLSSFWVIPFLGGHSFMTDMKYTARPSGASDSFWKMFFPLAMPWNVVILALALAGFIGSFRRRRFIGVWMGAYCIVLAAGVVVARDSLPVIGLLWNPRILPFLYLLRYMLAVIGVYEIAVMVARFVQAERFARHVSEIAEAEAALEGDVVGEQVEAETELVITRPPTPIEDLRMNQSTVVMWVVAVFALLVLGFRYQQLPGGSFSTSNGQTKYGWGPISIPANRGFSDGWARWNFQGYEGKTSYAEYHDIVQAMKGLGENPAHGCGRALWENNGGLNKYGTTMALMLLPFWTKGCIASMEGLFFEAAGTTPYHFISAAALSKQSSNPVRELRYTNNNAAIGVDYMRMLGIRYYMAFTEEAITEAKKQPELVEVATSGPWHVYEITDTTLVEPLTTQPVVVNKREGDPRERWLELGTSYFQNTSDWEALPVAGGPDDWQRIDVAIDVDRRIGKPGEPGRQVDVVVPDDDIVVKSLPTVTVTDVQLDDESISFRVDKVGVPVLVKVSYFPNWKAHGASSPVRAAPNMMVVIPTSNEVRLAYEQAGLDFFAYVLTSLGLIIFVLMLRRPLRFGVSMPPRG